MTVAVNQPYIFPYLGYFQLVHAADIFVVYDDVQWIEGGWINRNRILLSGAAAYLTLPVTKAGMDGYIKDYEFAPEFGRQQSKMIKRLEVAYRKAPFFDEVMPLVEKCLLSRERNVSRFAVTALHDWCVYLGIRTRILLSSDLPIEPGLVGQQRVVAISAMLGATRYINLIGGRSLYNEMPFQANGVELRFVQMRLLEYRQVGGGPFMGHLSIIDVAMNNSRSELRSLLEEYDLVRVIDKSESIQSS